MTASMTCPRHVDCRVGTIKVKEITCLGTGEVFSSIGSAAEACGVSKQAMSQAVRRGGTCAGEKWAYHVDGKDFEARIVYVSQDDARLLDMSLPVRLPCKGAEILAVDEVSVQDA